MFLGSLDPLKASRNWGIVFKSCGSAAMRKPSVRALLGVALAESRMEADRPTCVEEVASRLRRFDQAMKFLDVAIQFREALGNKSDVDDRTFFRYQNKIVEAQMMIFETQRKCLSPVQSEPPRN